MNPELEKRAVADHTRHKPLVSIGMPVYNGAKYIREALDSLLAQTFTDFELIISDNASTDETETICREYAAKDKRIHYIRQPVNRGAGANFQFVLDEAVGEYFMWAAGDDIWDPKWIERLLPICVSENCIAFGTVLVIDAAGRAMKHPANGRNFSYQGTRFIRRLKYYIEPAVLGKANPIYGIYPKSLLASEAFSVFASNMEGADMLFLYNLLERTEIKAERTVCLYKRFHHERASVVAKSNSHKNYPIRVIAAYFKALAFHQYLFLRGCANRSNVLEKLLLFSLLPLSLAGSVSVQIINHLRFSRSERA